MIMVPSSLKFSTRQRLTLLLTSVAGLRSNMLYQIQIQLQYSGPEEIKYMQCIRWIPCFCRYIKTMFIFLCVYNISYNCQHKKLHTCSVKSNENEIIWTISRDNMTPCIYHRQGNVKSVNSLRLGYIRPWPGLSFVKKMACHLFGTKP